MKIKVVRDVITPSFTLGEIFINGSPLGYTVEDTDRKLESGGVKVKTKTAIPRGEYEVIVSYSPKYKRYMPEVLNVPQFSGIRIHSGNTPSDTEGCIIVGAYRDEDKGVVSESRKAIARVYDLIFEAFDNDEKIILEVV